MFRFPLESLLRLRASLEHVEEVRLLEANQDVERQRAQITAAEKWGRVLNERCAAELHDGANGAELHFELACREQLHILIRRLQKQLVVLLELRARQQERYAQVRREREVLEQLRTEQFARYRIEEARREQRRADDLFLLRRRYRQPG